MTGDDRAMALAEVQVYAGSPNQAPVNGWNFQIHVRSSDKCIDMTNNTTTAQAWQWDCWGGANQVFQTIDVGNGFWQLKNRSTGMCLDQKGSTSNSGIYQWACMSGNPNQNFKFNDAGGGYYNISSQTAPTEYFDIYGGPSATQNGAVLNQWSNYNTNSNQQFKLVPVP